jgi:hypothetical protein
VVTVAGSLGNATTNTGDIANDNLVNIVLGNTSEALTPGLSLVGLRENQLEDLAGNYNPVISLKVNGALIINELQYAGMNNNSLDQYIELKNMTSSLLDFSLQNYVLCRGENLIYLLDNGQISGDSYLLISNLDKNTSILNLDPDYQGFVNPLLDSGNLDLSLRLGSSCLSGEILDQAGDNDLPSIGGNNLAIERKISPADGKDYSNWYEADSSSGFDNLETYGTPRSKNILDAQKPNFLLDPTDTRIPQENILTPNPYQEIKIEYEDNEGGVGINPALTKIWIFVDNNNNGEFDAGDTGWGEVTESSNTLINTSRLKVSPSSPLIAGKNTVRVEIVDMSGNKNSIYWNFWVDKPEFKILEENPADLDLMADNRGYTENSTKIEVKTYGAGFKIKAEGNLLQDNTKLIPDYDGDYGMILNNSGGTLTVDNELNCSNSNFSSDSTDYNPTSNPQIISVNRIEDMTSSNCLKTYTYYIKYGVKVNAMQEAGKYQSDINYNLEFNY